MDDKHKQALEELAEWMEKYDYGFGIYYCFSTNQAQGILLETGNPEWEDLPLGKSIWYGEIRELLKEGE